MATAYLESLVQKLWTYTCLVTGIPPGSILVKKQLVTTIIPVHNRPVQLVDAVESVVAQTYRPVEIIIVDDGSTDCTLEIANELSEKYDSIRVIHQKNSGPGAAREAGRQQAQGEFIQYLDSDDILIPDKFMLQVSGLNHRKDCDISYGITCYTDGKGKVLEKEWKSTGRRISTMFPSMLKERWWGTSTPLYRSSILDHAGPWLDLINEEDWEYDCRLASRGAKLHYIASVISEERGHEGQRLSTGGTVDPAKLKDRSKAHQLIYGHARKAGITPDTEEMKHFSRELFLLSRQCGVVGLAEESKMLFNLSRKASTTEQRNNLQYRFYKLGANLVGWGFMGQLSQRLDKRRK